MPAGRPKKQLTPEDAYKLAKIGCTLEEVADFFGINVDTVYARKNEDKEFSDALKKGYSEMKQSLRRKQLQAAEKGNPTLLVWLGKQVLGQRDKQDIELANREGESFRTETLSSIPTDNLLKALQLLEPPNDKPANTEESHT